jgi:hypothetical protein
MARVCASKNELSDSRVDSVGSDDEVIRASRTVSEDHVNLITLLSQRCHSGAESHRNAGRAIEQYPVKVMTSDTDARTDRLPECCQLDLRQLLSGVIQNPLMRHADSPSKHPLRKTERAESSNSVAGKIKAGTAGGPRGHALDDFRNEALLAKCSGECETSDSAADNQDA